MNKNFIPTPLDEQLRLEASATKTATFAGTSFDNGAGFAPGGCGQPFAAVVKVSAGDFTTGDETYTFTVEESDDNASFTTCSVAVSPDTATPNLKVGAFSVPGFLSKRYHRLRCVIAGTTPSITYEAWLNPNLEP
jgi:hypothetical protein